MENVWDSLVAAFAAPLIDYAVVAAVGWFMYLAAKIEKKVQEKTDIDIDLGKIGIDNELAGRLEKWGKRAITAAIKQGITDPEDLIRTAQYYWKEVGAETQAKVQPSREFAEKLVHETLAERGADLLNNIRDNFDR